MIKDSGDRTEFETGAKRDMHAGKGRMDLLPWYGIMEVSKHCEEGAVKYGEHNVDKGIPLHSLLDSASRHLAKYMVGMDDEDHLRAACWNLLWALNQRVTHPELDDRFVAKRETNTQTHSDVNDLINYLPKAYDLVKKKCLECSKMSKQEPCEGCYYYDFCWKFYPENMSGQLDFKEPPKKYVTDPLIAVVCTECHAKFNIRQSLWDFNKKRDYHRLMPNYCKMGCTHCMNETIVKKVSTDE